MKNKKIRGIALNSIICAAYVTLCYTLNAVSFGPLQFRVATLLLPFGILDKRLAKGLVLGVIVANLSSSLGIIDIITGACIQILQFYVFAKVVKNIYLNSIIYALLSGTFVGLELLYVLNVPFLYSFLNVGISGMVLFLIGIPLCNKLLKYVNEA